MTAATSPIRFAVRMGSSGTAAERETSKTWPNWKDAKRAADRIIARREWEGFPVYPASVHVVIAPAAIPTR